MGSLGGWEIVIIIGVLVLLFGAKKLPDMARSVGQSARVFKGEMKGMKSDDEAEAKAKGTSQATPPPPAQLPPPSTPPQAGESTPAPGTQGRTDTTA
ncbi:MAG: Sec-independent protein translocase subunit TatA [Pseudonocardia sp.]|uniref:Sec-independent protein translocase subunit TatA n=1 Tax=unclassified Pseudonocardia TaxID=2619320 RepID=UPI00086F4A3C|nr:MULTISPECIES: Sec-independent protein translocase subunit TatA [unclassified Pseudonocardia]MBN9108131.1 Sec-independent protein translocase subunit TatA [Pseudonocardia sp.]ODV06186.1 MAG: preprotein translocase subunit TatA [Pseudonocardia sp. SCN 73-27]